MTDESIENARSHDGRRRACQRRRSRRHRRGGGRPERHEHHQYEQQRHACNTIHADDTVHDDANHARDTIQPGAESEIGHASQSGLVEQTPVPEHGLGLQFWQLRRVRVQFGREWRSGPTAGSDLSVARSLPEESPNP